MPKGVYLVFPKSEFRPPEFHPSLIFAYVVVIDLIIHIVIAYRHFIYLYNSFCWLHLYLIHFIESWKLVYLVTAFAIIRRGRFNDAVWNCVLHQWQCSLMYAYVVVIYFNSTYSYSLYYTTPLMARTYLHPDSEVMHDYNSRSKDKTEILWKVYPLRNDDISWCSRYKCSFTQVVVRIAAR
jgi:hypothetical protein